MFSCLHHLRKASRQALPLLSLRCKSSGYETFSLNSFVTVDAAAFLSNLGFVYRCVASDLTQLLVSGYPRPSRSGAAHQIAEQLPWLAKHFAAGSRHRCQEIQWAAFSCAKHCHRACLQRAAAVESRIVTIAGSLSFTAPGQVS